MSNPRYGEVYMYKGKPVLVYGGGKTWLHKHPYVKVTRAGVMCQEKEKILREDWDKLIPVITRDGYYTYHSFTYMQHQVPEMNQEATENE